MYNQQGSNENIHESLRNFGLGGGSLIPLDIWPAPPTGSEANGKTKIVIQQDPYNNIGISDTRKKKGKREERPFGF